MRDVFTWTLVYFVQPTRGNCVIAQRSFKIRLEALWICIMSLESGAGPGEEKMNLSIKTRFPVFFLTAVFTIFFFYLPPPKTTSLDPELSGVNMVELLVSIFC